jgi:Concanavalin A-like lectin/glucanases superfamily
VNSPWVCPVVLQAPVEWRHPLNHRLVRWWLTLPTLAGGTRWQDLTGGVVGTLSTFAAPPTATSGWGTTSRAGGAGELRCDGASDTVTIAAVTQGVGTLSAWARSTSASNQQLVSGVAENNQFRLEAGGAVRALTNGAAEIDVTTTGVNVLDGLWHLITFVNNGTNALIYVDGVQRISGTGSTNARVWDALTARTGAEFLNGAIDDVRIWARALSQAEIGQYLVLSSTGYPGLLARVPGWWAPSAAVASILRQMQQQAA